MSYHPIGAAMRKSSVSARPIRATSSGVFQANVLLSSASTCGRGFTWCPPKSGKPGYCARKRADGSDPCGPPPAGVTVRETPVTTDQQKCIGGKIGSKTYTPYRGDSLKKCKAWVGAGNDYDDFKYVFSCERRGYVGESLGICAQGLKQGRSFAEIDEALAALQQEAAMVSEQQAAAMASAKRKKMLIYGGVAVAGAAGLILFLKKRRK